jgi:glycosyltransferase involved in cell wall biosynthesis
MAAGLPVVAICESGNDIARVVSEADCGVHILPGDSRSLADAVRKYQECPSLAEAQGKRARRYFERHFTPDIGMSTYESVFADMAGQPIKEEILAGIQ